VADLPQVEIRLNPDPYNFQGDSRPVELVSWHEAVEFCQRLSRLTNRQYRLPSEAEWEYACRAETTTPFYFGETLTPKLAKCKANLGMAIITLNSGETAPVGSYLPNAFGLYDMHGNVDEWCADFKHDDYIGAPTDGTAWIVNGNSESRVMRGGSWSESRVMRGGSWFYNPYVCRSAFRNYSNPDFRYYFLGFRVVCGLA
jgi:formylglycine-generating enzyme required for sulfatase activity